MASRWSLEAFEHNGVRKSGTGLLGLLDILDALETELQSMARTLMDSQGQVKGRTDPILIVITPGKDVDVHIRFKPKKWDHQLGIIIKPQPTTFGKTITEAEAPRRSGSDRVKKEK
jgi:hypothetical protein